MIDSSLRVRQIGSRASIIGCGFLTLQEKMMKHTRTLTVLAFLAWLILPSGLAWGQANELVQIDLEVLAGLVDLVDHGHAGVLKQTGGQNVSQIAQL
jgi:predicted histidine transporter YuiF (NhaC family)